MALKIFLSNSLEILAEEFKKKLCLPMRGTDPFASVCGVVPNSGMSAFLKRHLARKNNLGIAANIEMPFLQKFLMDGICCFLQPEERENFRNSIYFWSPGVLSWRIDALLAGFPEKFREFTDYCAGDPVKRHLLACELAGNFDRYQLYRSTVTGHKELKKWRTRETETLQGKLYHELCGIMPDPDTFYEKFFTTSGPCGKLPARTGVFGISTMPALYLHALKKFAEHSDIFLFCPSPCKEYWGDIQSAKESLEELKHDPVRAQEILEASAASNHLLADFGVAGREFFNLLLDENCFTGDDSEEQYIDPAPAETGNALQLFQSDILNARIRDEVNKFAPSPGDNSIRINCCTDARRELEILHDQLLELFYSKDPQCKERKAACVSDDLRIEDVIVMFPDINKAAPMIDAVFSAGPFKGHYAICDRSSASQSQVIECFNRLLELPSGRANSLEILELLEFECLSSRLKLDSEAVIGLTDLVARSRISWGLDEQEHEKFRLKDFKEFSWEDGIDRLLEEFARGEDVSVICGVPDSGGIDGSLAENFAVLAGFISLLKEWRAQLHLPRTPKAWTEFMLDWIDRFFSGGAREFKPEINELKRAAGKTASDAAATGENTAIDSKVFISRLKSEYSLPGGKQHFLRDKITFCSLVPLRAIPAKVIAVLGLNDGTFPGIDRRNTFDLLTQIRRNDPNLSNDGRYLFLEALLAAKENLILSYVGFDNGQELAPAIPMVTLEDVLSKGFSISRTKIPLKSVELETLSPLRRSEETVTTCENGPSAEPVEIPSTLSIGKLHELLTQNCEGFFRIHCGFDYEEYEKKVPQTDDPDTLDSLDTAAVQKALWTMRIAGIAEDKWYPMVERVHVLLFNGQSICEELKEPVMAPPDEFVEAFRTQTALACEMQFGETVLTGTLGVPAPLKEDVCRYEVHFSKLSSAKLFKFYLEHLLLTSYLGEGKKVTGKLVFAKEKKEQKLYSFPVFPDAAEKLRKFMETALRTYVIPSPLPVFVNASFEYAQKKKAAAATKAFLENDVKYNRVIEEFFDEDNFSRGEFESLAQELFSDIARMKPGVL